MAKKSKNTQKQEKQQKSGSKPKKGGFASKLRLLLLSTIAVLVLQQSVIMLLIGMLPSFVAYIVDNTNSRSWFKTVFCFNLAAMLPYLAELYFDEGNSSAAMQAQMGDFTMWLLIYSSAGLAWVVIWACPKIAAIYLKSYHDLRAQEHRRKFQRLKEEWGINTSLSE